MYKVFTDDNGNDISIDTYLLNKEVFCIKTITDTDFKTIISAYSTILITHVECDEVRKDCHFIEIKFKNFKGEEREMKIYVDGGKFALPAFVRETFFPVHETFIRLTENNGRFIFN